ncbi:Stk1 family PASTA domain-containing Ser/Thr kinase [Streptomyces clavuligerus]|uniref:non-specific serine/threonine protein kinase n=1 Tax=Streptomyces clavuligerus TaxID=1901 RepID=B5GU60_STRCL|nr:Stk1 family PASTA domain-containing Ser/Thr kinase [Streptomyces clavuligerus]ANW19185.1 serine/threonine protein kinase [Streptomyces clavuligerus]AXU13781.1 serine/threonine protein kinase [Streptomyces clavuligerus]EDY49856.1 serine/threonine-protein kinase pksC [Streptomyces clavuligerus]EFG08062.1 Serine/threonine-protein kinase pksC [Streptomyces clavuligerus]MBY6303746.1 protein kinase [Streptomyces clavuligerus]
MSQHGAGGHYPAGFLAGGRYQLCALLGEGGMAAVHLAYDTALDRQVAIKTLHTELGREQSFRERFRREAQAVAKLSHPNIVSVFDTGEDTVVPEGARAPAPGALPMPYIVMEYVRGSPLGSVLQEDVRRYGAMPADTALRVAADVLAALETSHEVGLVHRDIKPGNVMMTPRGVVKVMDFGIARAMQSGVASMTQTGMVVGTPQYLSPEQALGRGVDARSDLYSVGVMLFQLLTGRLPFDADGPLAIVYAHVQEAPVAPSTINRSVTPAMDALVARALRKNPAERFPTAAAMREECERVAAAGQQTAPVIVSGGPAPGGAGVGSAVFPPVHPANPVHPAHPMGPVSPVGPVSQGHPGHPGFPQGVAPYAQPAGPYGSPVPGHPPPGHPAPPYGYPQGPQGPGAPAAYQPHQPTHPHQPGYPHQLGHPHQPVAPPATSFTISPAPPRPGNGGGSPRRKRARTIAVTIASVLLGTMFIGMLQAWLNSEDFESEPERPARSTAPGAAQDANGTGSSGAGGEALPPDRNRKIDPARCSGAMEDGTDPAKVQSPDLLYKDVLSVKECLRSAGWTWTVIEVDNPQWPKDTVVRQFPSQGTAVAPKNQEFELHLSTGRAG